MLELKLQKTLGPGFSLDVAFNISQGQCLGLYGPSGSGKTSLLRAIAGLLRPGSGFARFEQQTWYDSEKGISLKPQKRPVGLVFQGDDLFQHMTVRRNVEFAAGKNQVDELLQLFELHSMAARYPGQLSGGEKQRVSLARAVARQPRVLLLDEPFSALDGSSREQVKALLKKIQGEFSLTMVLVSHDTSDLYQLCDQLVKLEEGRVVSQIDSAALLRAGAVSGKFQFTGTVISIVPADLLYLVVVEVQGQLVRVMATADTVQGLKTSDPVMLVTKAFNPVIQKLSV